VLAKMKGLEDRPITMRLAPETLAEAGWRCLSLAGRWSGWWESNTR